MSQFVLDCSVSAAWCLQDENSSKALTILDRLAHDTAVVPALWCYEMANVLLVAERKGRITPAIATREIELLLQLPISLVEQEKSRLLHEVKELARQYSLSVYDASYLDLSLQAALPLVSFDKRLVEAATACGVDLIL